MNRAPTLSVSRERRQKTAFVLAGGGSLGAVQVGMLRALLENGVTPDLILGSSVGAINAAYFAGDPTLAGIERMAELWRNVKRSDIFPMSWRRVFGFLYRRDHLVEADGLRRLVDLHLPFRNLEDAQIPVHVIATDILTGSSVSMTRGSAVEAILASAAIPGAFPPVEVAGRLLCDGAVASNTPVQAAVAAGAKRVIVLPTGFACAPERAPRGAIECALHAITLLTARQLASELGSLAPSIGYHILPTTCPNGISPFDFARAAELMDTSHQNALLWIREGGLERQEIAPASRPHKHVSLGRRRASTAVALESLTTGESQLRARAGVA